MNQSISVCPHCHQPVAEIPNGPTWDFSARTFSVGTQSIRFSHRNASVFDALFRHRNRGAIDSTQALADRVYANEINGGPDTGENSVSVALVHIRNALAPLGWTITKSLGRPKIGFRLVPM